MSEAVARMDAAEALDANAARNAGLKAGETWARETARRRELTRLEKAVEALEREGGLVAVDNNGLNRGSAVGIAEAITGEEKMSHRDAEFYWGTILGEKGKELMDEDDFANGFVEGALEFWGKVQSAG